MPKVIVEADLQFERQLKDLLVEMGIEERYKTLQAVKAAVRQYRPLKDYWVQKGPEFKCLIRLGHVTAILTIYDGTGVDGISRIMIKSITKEEESYIQGNLFIPLLI